MFILRNGESNPGHLRDRQRCYQLHHIGVITLNSGSILSGKLRKTQSANFRTHKQVFGPGLFNYGWHTLIK